MARTRHWATRHGGADDIQVLAAGLVRLDDPRIRATARDGPPTVAPPIARQGRVTLLHAREKVRQNRSGAARATCFRERPARSHRRRARAEAPIGCRSRVVLTA